jgi:crossover junction endodeoxyribonuclease RuvC
VIILGLDPGLAALGYGIIDVHGSRMTPVASGVLRTKKRIDLAVGQDLAVRVGELARQFGELLDQQLLEEAALEEFRFYGKSVTSSIQVATVVGMLGESLRARGIPVAAYSAREIKHAVTGYANADKHQVQKMVRLLLKMDAPPKPEHAADALAAAITHATRLPFARAVGATR